MDRKFISTQLTTFDNKSRRVYMMILTIIACLCPQQRFSLLLSDAFTIVPNTPHSKRQRHWEQQHHTKIPNISSRDIAVSVTSSSSSGKGFGVQTSPRPTTKTTTSITAPTDSDITNRLSPLPLSSLKNMLLDLLPRMTGKRGELEEITVLVNLMEKKFTPVETLEFLNMAMEGEWQLLFSTNRLGMPTTELRLRELIQRVLPQDDDDSDGTRGNIDTIATWDLAEDGLAFGHTGTFTIKNTYTIDRYPRLNLSLAEHVIQPRGDIPKDVPRLFGMLHRAIPTEMFDPDGLGMDTTYVDADLRIVRLAGGKHEGVRNIFIRRGGGEDEIRLDPGRHD